VGEYLSLVAFSHSIFALPFALQGAWLAAEGMPAGAPYNVGQMYYLFGQAIRTGEGGHPDFDTAVDLHRFLDAIRESSDQGRRVAVAVG